MMQVLVMYYSKTGNTRKLAEEVARGGGYEIRATN